MASAASLLKGLAKKAAPASKKETTPVLELDKSLKPHLEEIVKQKKIEKTAEASRKKAEGLVRPVATKMREQHCLSKSQFTSGVKLTCDGVGPVSFSTQNRYSVIPGDEEDKLKNIFGKNYDKCIMTQTNISCTDKALRDIDKVLPRLMLAMSLSDEDVANLQQKYPEEKQSESFAANFEVEQHLKPTEYMHEHRVLDPEIKAAADKAIDEGLLKPVTPSFSI